MAMINCSECGNKISDQAEICPHCGIHSTILLEKKREIAQEKLIAIIFKPLIIGVIVIIFYVAFFSPKESSFSRATKPVSNSNNSSYCYDMWYKYGSCAYLSANGLPCKAGTNVIIPIECQNFSGKIEASKAGMLSNK